MRRSGSWQSVWDDRILEWIRENDGTGSAAQMDESDIIRRSRSTISRRLNILEEHGLLRDIGNGVYAITDEGKAYLDEEYDAEEGVYLTGDQSVEAENDVQNQSQNDA